ncbi:Mu transposase C-terminal domain-containing protein [Rhizobium mongolense]|uniref:Mu transposase C-terminal domain-containing protein n=2 Tax=Rhizobium mongolense TaxID=57676 RepID=UPI002D798D8F|nr:Mu transposase C-terminal domain-containing protein [Rhizobium mongolense]
MVLEDRLPVRRKVPRLSRATSEAKVRNCCQIGLVAGARDHRTVAEIPLRLPQDRMRFWLALLPEQERTLRPTGIHLFGLRYWSPARQIRPSGHGPYLRTATFGQLRGSALR